jgi:hypothetical protein
MALTRYVGLFLGLVSIAVCQTVQDDEINWLGNYREALQQAKQTRKPIVVEFRCEA